MINELDLLAFTTIEDAIKIVSQCIHRVEKLRVILPTNANGELQYYSPLET